MGGTLNDLSLAFGPLQGEAGAAGPSGPAGPRGSPVSRDQSLLDTRISWLTHIHETANVTTSFPSA